MQKENIHCVQTVYKIAKHNANSIVKIYNKTSLY